MRRKPLSRPARKTIGVSRRPLEADVPAVPVFQPDPSGPVAPPHSVDITDDPIDDAIRRMVEAAYT